MTNKPKLAPLFLVALLFIGLSSMPILAGPTPKVVHPLDRSYYLTKSDFRGDQPLTACVDGYHFASIFEMHGFGSMVYNTEYGYTSADSGFGPPTWAEGWIRTGGGLGEYSNCLAWTEIGYYYDVGGPLQHYYGTTMDFGLATDTNNPVRASSLTECRSLQQVWCVSDPSY